MEQARSDRKRLLFGVACRRRVWHLLPDENCREAVALAERFAQGAVSAGLRNEARALARRAAPESDQSATGKAVSAVCRLLGEEWSLYAALYSSRDAAAALLRPDLILEEQAAQAALLRDILGNPFAPVRVDPAWLAWSGGATVALAKAIYDESAFEQAPILADALEEAGCRVAAILDHLRGPGPHARGCWVIDRLLEKI